MKPNRNMGKRTDNLQLYMYMEYIYCTYTLKVRVMQLKTVP